MRLFHIILVSVVLCACGGGTIRKSAMYGDGTAYVPVSQDRIHRKFYIRDIAVKNWPGCNVGLFNNVPDAHFKGPTISVSPESISRFVPELIREKPLPGDVAVDLEVKFVDHSTSGFWTIPLVYTLVLPGRLTQDWSFDVKITVGQEKVPLPVMSSKLSAPCSSRNCFMQGSCACVEKPRCLMRPRRFCSLKYSIMPH